MESTFRRTGWFVEDAETRRQDPAVRGTVDKTFCIALLPVARDTAALGASSLFSQGRRVDWRRVQQSCVFLSPTEIVSLPSLTTIAISLQKLPYILRELLADDERSVLAQRILFVCLTDYIYASIRLLGKL